MYIYTHIFPTWHSVFFFFLQIHSNVSTSTTMILINSINQKISSSCPFVLKSFSYPQSLATTDVFSIPTVLPFPECHLNKIIQYGSGFLELAKSICDFADSNSSFSFTVEWYDLEYGCTTDSLVTHGGRTFCLFPV